jgi:hypothetical protein
LGNLGRNVLRGFGAWQDNLAIRRQIRLTEKVGLQLRAEIFNVFNHPNFGIVSTSATLSNALFGQSTQMLGTSLAGNKEWLNPLYQLGGPRSIQFAAKLCSEVEIKRGKMNRSPDGQISRFCLVLGRR